VERNSPTLHIEGHREEEILFHCELLVEAGLLQGQVVRGRSGERIGARLEKLTWEGSDFLDVARSETKWKKAKAQIVKTGVSWTFEIVKSVLVEISKGAFKGE
jgi:hypothetical protein